MSDTDLQSDSEPVTVSFDDNPFAHELLIPVDREVEDLGDIPTLEFDIEEFEIPNEDKRKTLPPLFYS